jgi:ADP-heptose:LPS heptosyltransferase
MKRAFISRFGGFGDILHASHLPRLIKEHYAIDHITFETNYQGYQILQGNPYIDELLYVPTEKITDSRLRKNWDWCEETYDMSFNLIYTIELAVCCNENDSRYYRSTGYRRKNFGQDSYYDVMTKACGLPDKYLGTRGGLYYSEEDHESAKAWVASLKSKHDANYLVLLNLSGTSLHKRFMQAENVARRILNDYPKSLIILTGDATCKESEFTGDRIISWVDKKNFRTVALMTKYLDLTISVETGLPLVAHSWDAPCLQLLTAASPANHLKGAKNAYWLQAPVACSPCHKNPREYWGCPSVKNMPACVWFDEDEVLAKVKEAYETR